MMGVTLTNQAGIARYIKGVPDLGKLSLEDEYLESYRPPTKRIRVHKVRMYNKLAIRFQLVANLLVCSLQGDVSSGCQDE